MVCLLLQIDPPSSARGLMSSTLPHVTALELAVLRRSHKAIIDDDYSTVD